MKVEEGYESERDLMIKDIRMAIAAIKDKH